jgi:hypothetical protein
MTTTASAHALPTVEPAQDAGILPCPHFEGVEKRVEIDFHDGSCEQGASPGLSRRAFGAHRRDALKNPNPPFRAPFGGRFEKP